ncbi:hypothetical protein OAK19_03035 [Aureispira]|nr:hypothetical protein [Aureispira sp.]
MKQFYMIEFDLPQVYINEITNRFTEQQKQIDIMISKGIIKSYSLAQNHSKLWIITSADSEFGIMEIISKLPLSDFMIPSIMPLKFNKSNQNLRELALN